VAGRCQRPYSVGHLNGDIAPRGARKKSIGWARRLACRAANLPLSPWGEHAGRWRAVRAQARSAVSKAPRPLRERGFPPRSCGVSSQVAGLTSDAGQNCHPAAARSDPRHRRKPGSRGHNRCAGLLDSGFRRNDRYPRMQHECVILRRPRSGPRRTRSNRHPSRLASLAPQDDERGSQDDGNASRRAAHAALLSMRTFMRR
jgi:hypothetical protein